MYRRIIAFAGAVALCGAACGTKAEAPAASAEEGRAYETADGVAYSIMLWRYSNATRPGGDLELMFHCYNRSPESVDGMKVFGDSTVSVTRPDGTSTAADPNPMGIWDGPAEIAPGSSHGVIIDVARLFGLDELGEYTVTWEVAGGEARFPVRVMDGPPYYLYRLDTDTCYNAWGLHLYGLDGYMGSGLGREAVALGEAMVPGLAARLDDRREGFIEGSEDATIASMYGWRVCDYAAIMLVEILGEDAGDLRSEDPAARDRRIAALKAGLGE